MSVYINKQSSFRQMLVSLVKIQINALKLHCTNFMGTADCGALDWNSLTYMMSKVSSRVFMAKSILSKFLKKECWEREGSHLSLTMNHWCSDLVHEVMPINLMPSRFFHLPQRFLYPRSPSWVWWVIVTQEQKLLWSCSVMTVHIRTTPYVRSRALSR